MSGTSVRWPTLLPKRVMFATNPPPKCLSRPIIRYSTLLDRWFLSSSSWSPPRANANSQVQDFFYTCQSHLSDTGFVSPVIDAEAEAAKKKKEMMDREIEKVKQEYEEKQKRKKGKKKAKDDEDDKAEKERDDKVKNITICLPSDRVD